MKKLFSILLSFQLMIAPLAMAADAVPGTEEATVGSDAYRKEGTGSKGGYDFYLNQIMSLATSSIGSSIITQCLEGLKTPSIAAFMAGSLTHIMSEIIGAKAKNERHQKKLKDLELKKEELKTKGDNSQLEALKAAQQEEQDTHDFLENRKKWMLAVTLIYTTAMGLAIAEELYGEALAASVATAACTAYAASCTVGAAACGAHCAGGVAGGVAWLKANTATPGEARSLISSTCASFSPALSGCMAYGNAYIGLVYGACQMVPVDGGVSQFSWGTLLSLAYGFAGSAAGAKQGKIAQYGQMVISLIPLVTASFSKLVVQMYNYPIPRSITFGAAAVFGAGVTIGLDIRQKKAAGNVNKLKEVVKNFTIVSDGVEEGATAGADGGAVAGAGGGTGGLNQPPKNQGKPNIKGLGDIPKRKECFSNGPKGVTHSAAGCSNPLKVAKYNPGNLKLGTLNTVASLAGDMANALAVGDENTAGQIAGQIGSYAAKIKAETNLLQKQYNEKQKKDKRPTTDFDKSIKAQVASLQGEFDKTAASKNMNLADLGAASAAEEKSSADSLVPEVTTASTPAVTIPAPEVSFGTETPAEDTTLATPGGSGQSLDEFESSVEDVAKTPEVSIFKQLSNRYILNYTKMFERKKDPEPVEETPTN